MTDVLIDVWVKSHQKRIHNILQEYFDRQEESLLKNACEYSLLNGGKRIRSLLVYAVGEDELIENKFHLDQIALSIELIHAYSLIHDDLPAMDDDPLRRGKPSCHIKFTEGQAILAGDALQSLAFEILSSRDFDINDSIKIKIINTLSRAIGLFGMAQGQSLDLISNNNHSSIDLLENLQELKTGALIKASCLMPYLLSANPNKSDETCMINIGGYIGKIFQITDDILDVSSDTGTLGKTAGKDVKNNKMTYVTRLGMDKALKIKASFFDDLNKEIAIFPKNLNTLQNLVAYIYSRKN